MKTATRTRIDRILKLCPPGMYQTQVSFELETILLEQDRDTRHACAEAIESMALTDYPTQMHPCLNQLKTRAKIRALEACLHVQTI